MSNRGNNPHKSLIRKLKDSKKYTREARLWLNVAHERLWQAHPLLNCRRLLKAVSCHHRSSSFVPPSAISRKRSPNFFASALVRNPSRQLICVCLWTKLKKGKKRKEQCECTEVSVYVVYILSSVKTENTYTLFDWKRFSEALSRHHSYLPGFEVQVSLRATVFSVDPDVS